MTGEEQPGRSRLMVCDDSATIRAVIGSMLEPLHECLVLSGAEEVLARAPEFRPDLVISDLLMVGMTGYELCQRMRADAAFRHVPIILLTSKTDEESRATGLEIGADDYLFKPIRPRELLARVASLLRLRRAAQELEARSLQLEEANRRLRETQGQLVQAEKLATVGTLAAGLAHEMNNPLGFMKSGATAIRELVVEVRAALGTPEVEPLLEEISTIGAELREGTLRLQRIAQDLRLFAAGSEAHVEELDLAEELALRFRLVEPSGAGPSLQLSVEGLPPIRTVRPLLGKVLQALLSNAVKAAGRTGWVRVEASEHEGAITVVVTDSGPGIPAQLLSRVFDPFFTTSSPGSGTGLGLSVAYGIMKTLRGTLEAASQPGEGARFTVRFPQRLPAAGYNELRTPGRAPASGNPGAAGEAGE